MENESTPDQKNTMIDDVQNSMETYLMYGKNVSSTRDYSHYVVDPHTSSIIFRFMIISFRT